MFDIWKRLGGRRLGKCPDSASTISAGDNPESNPAISGHGIPASPAARPGECQPHAAKLRFCFGEHGVFGVDGANFGMHCSNTGVLGAVFGVHTGNFGVRGADDIGVDSTDFGVDGADFGMHCADFGVDGAVLGAREEAEEERPVL